MQDQDKQSATLRHSSEKIQQPKHLKIESYLQLLIALDKKSTALKDIQGKYGKKDTQQARSLQSSLKMPMKA
jgi:hypothetical protein